MKAPDPLPVAGDWIVTDDGSRFEVRHCAPDHCTMTLADADGAYAWLADAEEHAWFPWSDVERIERAEATESEPVRSRFRLTISHRDAVGPTPAVLDAIADTVGIALRLGGIRGARVTIEPEP